ncbi:hypothetical protein M127_3773 [Bacteroides fragilis str. S6L5]|nr:hypothetical protein M127_3773 [Bacteroides fragilis str. S6L5]
MVNKTKMADNCLIISHFFVLPKGVIISKQSQTEINIFC